MWQEKSLLNTQQIFNADLQVKYNKRFKKYGANPEGSYWISAQRQNLRFDVIFEYVIKYRNKEGFSVGDIGCGYGALLPYIENNYCDEKINYSGYDISKELIDYCKRNYHQNWVKFFRGSRPIKNLDFCVISGAFNLSATKIYSEWEDHIFQTLSDCWQKTDIALVFNLQTSDTPHISKGSFFYGDKQVIANRCNSLFGNTSHLRISQLPYDTTFIIKRE